MPTAKYTSTYNGKEFWRYGLVWGGFSDGIIDNQTGERVISASQFTENGWLNLIGASDEFITKVALRRLNQ